MIVIVPGSNLTLLPEEILLAEKKIKTAKLVCFGLEGNHDSVVTVSRMAKKHGVKTMTNAAPASSDLNPLIFELTDILCVNETEAQLILGQTNF